MSVFGVRIASLRRDRGFQSADQYPEARFEEQVGLLAHDARALPSHVPERIRIETIEGVRHALPEKHQSGRSPYANPWRGDRFARDAKR